MSAIKYTIHVPSEAYGFIAAELEGTADDAVAAYREVADILRSPKYGAGMEKKKFDQIIDNMLAKQPNQMDPGELEEMNSIQSHTFNELRKALGRVAYKQR